MGDILDDFLDTDNTMDKIKSECEEVGASTLNGSNNTEYDKNITVNLTDSVRELAVKKSLVPRKYANAKFDIEYIKDMVGKNIKGTMYRVENFNNYINICCEILSDIRLGRLPERSWIIGAPNDFGKTTFVNECIITMEDKGMKTVPYISLFELAELRVNEEQRLLNSFYYKDMHKQQSDANGYTYIEPKSSDFIKKPVDVVGNYSWSEYMNSDCLFCYFSDVSSRQVESRVLYHILSVRGAKCLPTIVMISTSLNPYIMDRILKEQVWDEILDNAQYSTNDKGIYDKVKHISTYKFRRNPIAEREDNNATY